MEYSTLPADTELVNLIELDDFDGGELFRECKPYGDACKRKAQEPERYRIVPLRANAERVNFLD